MLISTLFSCCFFSLYSFEQMFVWTAVDQGSLRLREPFVVDVCASTIEHIDELLTWACEGTDVAWPPPPQEKECIATAALNLLRLQVRYFLDHIWRKL